MSDEKPDLDRVRRELRSLERDLSKAADQWEPPTARKVLGELLRVVRVLQELYEDPAER